MIVCAGWEHAAALDDKPFQMFFDCLLQQNSTYRCRPADSIASAVPKPYVASSRQRSASGFMMAV